jgi:hypothetical protein
MVTNHIFVVPSLKLIGSGKIKGQHNARVQSYLGV